MIIPPSLNKSPMLVLSSNASTRKECGGLLSTTASQGARPDMVRQASSADVGTAVGAAAWQRC